VAWLPLVISFLIFVPLAWLAGQVLPLRHRGTALAVLNLLALYPLCVLAGSGSVRFYELPGFLAAAALACAVYVLIVLVQYSLIRNYAGSTNSRAWIPILFPIVTLVLVKLLPASWLPLFRHARFAAARPLPVLQLGISYMAFRLSHLAMEVRTAVVPRPALAQYLGFAFLVPTLAVGPINPYSRYAANPARTALEPARALLRVLVGLTKYIFLANLCNQLSYAGLIFDGHPHAPIDLLVAMVASYLYLYLNFSGYCDMAIGAAGLLGIPVIENFDNPFVARNVREFWNRWHISLSLFMRDMVFTPFSKKLVGLFGVRYSNHAVALAIVAVFVLIGLWHGLAWNFLLFGVLHGAGVVVNHYYSIALKTRLGASGFARYNQNRTVRAVGIAVTFTFVAFTIMFFFNSLADLKAIASLIRIR
jgi:D-alanyl-lipoteichoic acid acyltransferase DltB (MBOAT superfamily)